MKIVKASQSSIGTYNHCAFKFFLEQILDIRPKSGKAALQGTIIHQVFEWMGKLKQKNKTNVDPLWLLDRAWDLHVSQNTEIPIRKYTSRGESADFKKCKKAVIRVSEDKYYSPYNLNKLISVENKYDIRLDPEIWGDFRVRGFIDIAHELDPETLEIVDWKSGAQKDFYTGVDKDLYAFMKDIQARIYHMAAVIMYPQYKNIILTFYFTAEDPVTFSLSYLDMMDTMSYLWRWFNRVKSDVMIRRNKTWRCRMCAFSKNDFCDEVWSEFQTNGSEYVKNKYYQVKLGTTDDV